MSKVDTGDKLTPKQKYLNKMYEASQNTFDNLPELDEYWDNLLHEKHKENLDILEATLNDDVSINPEKVLERIGHVEDKPFIQQLNALYLKAGVHYRGLTLKANKLVDTFLVRYDKFKNRPDKIKLMDNLFDTHMGKLCSSYGLKFDGSISFLDMKEVLNNEIPKGIIRSININKTNNTEEDNKMSKNKNKVVREEMAATVENGVENPTVNAEMNPTQDLGSGDLSTLEGIDNMFDEADVPENIADKVNEATQVLSDSDVNLPKVGDKTGAKQSKPKTEQEKEIEKRRREIMKQIKEEVKEELISPLAHQSLTKAATDLKQIKALNSEHVICYGFLTKYNDKIVPSIKTIKPKPAERDEKPVTYEFVFNNQKPSKQTHMIINGPRVLLNSLATNLTQSKLREYSKVGMVVEGDIVEVKEQQAKDRITVCLPIKAAITYLMSLCTIDGIAEAPELNDLVFGNGENQNGVLKSGTRIFADYSTYIRNKMKLQTLNKQLDAYKHDPAIMKDNTSLEDINNKIAKLAKLVANKENSNNVATLKASTRTSKRLLTRKNYIPINRFNTVNPFTTNIDLEEPTRKVTYGELLSQSVTCDNFELVNNAVVCADKKHIKFFEPTSKVSIADKEELFHKSVSVKKHWYTGQPLQPADMNVVVRFPGEARQVKNKTRIPFTASAEGLNFTDNLELSKYTVNDIENQTMLQLIGVEKFKEFVTATNLGLSKVSGSRRKSSKISKEIYEAVGVDLLSKMKVDFDLTV